MPTQDQIGRHHTRPLGAMHERLAELLPPGMTARIDVSITDEPPLAQVIVIISAVPETRLGEAQPTS